MSQQSRPGTVSRHLHRGSIISNPLGNVRRGHCPSQYWQHIIIHTLSHTSRTCHPGQHLFIQIYRNGGQSPSTPNPSVLDQHPKTRAGTDCGPTSVDTDGSLVQAATPSRGMVIRVAPGRTVLLIRVANPSPGISHRFLLGDTPPLRHSPGRNHHITTRCLLRLPSQQHKGNVSSKVGQRVALWPTFPQVKHTTPFQLRRKDPGRGCCAGARCPESSDLSKVSNPAGSDATTGTGCRTLVSATRRL